MRHIPVSGLSRGKCTAIKGFVLAVGPHHVLARHFTNKPLHDHIQGVYRAARSQNLLFIAEIEKYEANVTSKRG
jgi:peptide methionine sulfoxide reductase MsrB